MDSYVMQAHLLAYRGIVVTRFRDVSCPASDPLTTLRTA